MLRKLALGLLLTMPFAATAQTTTPVSAVFTLGVVGTTGQNTNAISDIRNLPSIGGALTVTFTQNSSTPGQFEIQGNDVCGTLTVVGVDSTSAPFSETFDACANWRVNTGKLIDYVGFVPVTGAAVNRTLTDGTGTYQLLIDAGAATANDANFLLKVRASAAGFNNGDSVSGNAAQPADAVLALNTYISATPDTGKPVISGPQNSTNAEGTGEDAKTVLSGSTAVHTFTANETVAWSVGGADASNFTIDADGNLVFKQPAVFDAVNPANNVYTITIVAVDAAGNDAVMTFTVTVVEPGIQGPSGEAGDDASRKVVDAGTEFVHQFSIEGGGDPSGLWSIRDLDVAKFEIDEETGDLAFLDAPEYIPGGDNIYQVWVVYTYAGDVQIAQLVTIEVRDTALAALNRNRADIEQIIVDAEISKLRGQQSALRSMTSSARDRLAGGACGGEDDEQQTSGSQEDEACRVDDTDLSVSSDETGLTVSGSNNRILTFNGYRRITNLNLAMTDSDNIRTLSFNGHFALETLHAENALYGVFAGISLNQSDVARGLDGGADSYGVSLGAYAVNELSENVFSEAYLSIGRSQNELDLTDGYLDVAADYGTTELHAGWILSGLIEKGDWDILPEMGIQLSRSQSSSIDVTGTIPGDTANVTWEGLTASLARANVSADFRHYLDGRADDAWILNFKPGVVCERVDAITVTSGCGATAGLGLNRTSADGRHRFTAEATVEEVEEIRRKAASLNYELRF